MAHMYARSCKQVFSRSWHRRGAQGPRTWQPQDGPLARGFEIWGFPKIRATFLGVPIIRIIVYWGLYWGLLILGNYHLRFGVVFPKA